MACGESTPKNFKEELEPHEWTAYRILVAGEICFYDLPADLTGNEESPAKDLAVSFWLVEQS